MKNSNLIIVLLLATVSSTTFAARYIRSVKGGRGFSGGGSYQSSPISPSRSRFISGGASSSYGGSSGGLAPSTGGSYGGGSSLGAAVSAGSYGGGGGSSQYAEEAHPAPEPYNFQYAANDEYGNNQYRNEEQDQSGTIRGSYGYTDANGLYRVVDYVADNDGFRAQIRSNEPGGLTELNPKTGSVENPADVQLSAEPVPSSVRQQQEQYAAAAASKYRAGGASSYGGSSSGGSSYGGSAGGSSGGYSFGGGSSSSSSTGGGASGYGGGFGGGGSGFRGGAAGPIVQQKITDKY